MNLDELKESWIAQNAQLSASLRLNAVLLRETGALPARSALSRLRASISVELLVNFAGLLALGSFSAAHLHAPRFFVPAVILHCCGIALISSGVRQLVLLSRVDFAEPILTTQKELEALRIQRLRTTKWILLLAPLLWTPLLIVALQGFLGIDAYAAFPSAWLAANVLVGLALVPLMLWIAARFADRFRDARFLRQLLDDIAGRNLSAARDHLERLASFEREAETGNI